MVITHPIGSGPPEQTVVDDRKWGQISVVWTHRFRVDAGVDEIYERGLAADRWFAFYPAYRGIDAVDDNWPQTGSTIVLRYSLAGPLTMRLRQTVVRHEREVFIEWDEQGLGGFWMDRPRFDFEANEDGSTMVTLTVRPTSRFLVARPLIWLISLPFAKLTPKAMKTFAASIEQSDSGTD